MMQISDSHTPKELRYLVTKEGWSMREIMLATAQTVGQLKVVEAIDELMCGVCAEREIDRWFAVDCAMHFLEVHEKSAPADQAEALSRLRILTQDFHTVLTAEALEAAAAKESQLS